MPFGGFPEQMPPPPQQPTTQNPTPQANQLDQLKAMAAMMALTSGKDEEMALMKQKLDEAMMQKNAPSSKYTFALPAAIGGLGDIIKSYKAGQKEKETRAEIKGTLEQLRQDRQAVMDRIFEALMGGGQQQRSEPAPPMSTPTMY